MNEKNSHAKPSAEQVYTFQNDVETLKRVFSLPEIDYADISQREQASVAIKRWPLLAELTRCR